MTLQPPFDLDVRPLFAAGRPPMPAILSAVNRLQPGQARSPCRAVKLLQAPVPRVVDHVGPDLFRLPHNDGVRVIRNLVRA